MERLQRAGAKRQFIITAVLTVAVLWVCGPRSWYNTFDLKYGNHEDLTSAVMSLHWLVRTIMVLDVTLFIYHMFGEDIRFYWTLCSCSIKAWDHLNKLDQEEKVVREAADKAVQNLHASQLSSSASASR